MIFNEKYEKPQRLFVGLEVEYTNFYGELTLFVGDLVPKERVLEELTARPDITHVYFGASGLSRIDTETVQAVSAKFPRLNYTLEGPLSLEAVDFAFFNRRVSVCVILPVTNNGIHIPDTAHALRTWEYADEYTLFVKIDTPEPYAYVFPFQQYVSAVATPADYAGDEECDLQSPTLS